MRPAFLDARTSGGQGFIYADEGTGPAVVLLHGFPDTPHGWEHAAGTLAASGYRAIRPWLRGYHRGTDVPGRAFGMREICEDAVRLLDALGLERAVLAGHDWGAIMAYGAAALAPERVQAVVAVALPHPSHLPKDLRGLWAARHFFELRAPGAQGRVARGDFRRLEDYYRRWAPDWTGPEREATLAQAKACFSDPASLEAALAYYRAVSPRIPRELAAPAAVRTLVAGGIRDGNRRSAYERTAAAAGPGSRAWVAEETGHWPHREAQERFEAELLRFLAEHVPAGDREMREAQHGN